MLSDRAKQLYDLMLRRGYPVEFTRLICLEMNTDFTAERMIKYVSAKEMHKMEDVADEMLGIKSFRDRLVEKHLSVQAQASINEFYRSMNGYLDEYSEEELCPFE